MNTFLEDNLQADLELLKATEKANKAIISYFNLLEHPYRGGPDFRFLFTTDQVKEAIAKCIVLTVERVNPVYMYGPFGTGKSTIIRRLYALLKRDKRFNVKFIILHDRVSGNSLLRDILDAFGVKPARSYDLSLKRFQRYLVAELPEEEYKSEKDGEKEYFDETKIPVLLIDEGQHMQKDALRLIHSLLNFETSSFKRLQIVITGQEGLAKNILGMGELASRMKGIAIYHMSAQELEKMLKFRWVVAGGKEEEFPFPNEHTIYQVLFEYTKGLPRDIIKVADDVLRHLMVQNKKQITITEIETIIQENNLSKETTKSNMAYTYSKLLGLSETHTPPSESGKAKLAQKPLSQERKVHLQTNQQTSKKVKKQIPQVTLSQTNENTHSPVSIVRVDKNLDTSLLNTKEKTKYGTYLTDESIEKIRICAIQTKRDDHQVVQEAINQYFERLGK